MATDTNLPAAPANLDVLRAIGLDRGGRWRHLGRRAVWAILVVAAFAAAALWIRARRGPSAPGFETRPAERHDLVVTVTASGTLEPWHTVDIGPEISGRVRAVRADYNDHITQGQILVELDTELLRAQVQQAESQVALAVATVAQARATREESGLALARIGPLARQGMASPSEEDAARAADRRAEAGLAAASAQERAARASLSVARTSLAKATIRSPIDGVVLARSVDEGQTVVAALQAPVLFRLAEDLGRMQLVVDVDEADIGRVHEGMAASFTVAAYATRTFAARVTQVRNAAQTLENVVTYEAVLEVDNQDGALRPGMTGTAQISAETEKDALTVPNAALRYRPRGSEATTDSSPRVWVLRQGRPVAVSVAPGPSDGTRTSIPANALAAGDAVIIGEKAGTP